MTGLEEQPRLDYRPGGKTERLAARQGVNDRFSRPASDRDWRAETTAFQRRTVRTNRSMGPSKRRSQRKL